MNWKHWLGVAGIAIVAVAIANRIPGLNTIVTPSSTPAAK